jgi:predicted CopG family antitoxin
VKKNKMAIQAQINDKKEEGKNGFDEVLEKLDKPRKRNSCEFLNWNRISNTEHGISNIQIN